MKGGNVNSPGFTTHIDLDEVYDPTCRAFLRLPTITEKPSLVDAILMLVTAVNQNTEAVLALADATTGVEEVAEAGEARPQYLDSP